MTAGSYSKFTFTLEILESLKTEITRFGTVYLSALLACKLALIFLLRHNEPFLSYQAIIQRSGLEFIIIIVKDRVLRPKFQKILELWVSIAWVVPARWAATSLPVCTLSSSYSTLSVSLCCEAWLTHP